MLGYDWELKHATRVTVQGCIRGLGFGVQGLGFNTSAWMRLLQKLTKQPLLENHMEK